MGSSMNEFEKLGIDEDFNSFYKEHGIKAPNAVQERVIPHIMEGDSTICIAQTGTGKTLGFALPLIELVKRLEGVQGVSDKKARPVVVVVVPTKELAMQIAKVFKDISHHVKFRARTIVGGAKGKASSSIKTQSYEVLVATPTRLARAVKSGEVNFESIKHLVFDEADQLFDMGFKKDIASILHPVSYDKTAIHFFSATWPQDMDLFIQEKFAKKNLKRIELGTAHKIQQKIDTFNIFVSPKEKNQMLKMFIEKTASGRGIVFINQKNQVDEVIAYVKDNLPKLKYKVIHGGMEQVDRLANHKAFTEGKGQILFATDVAARGIDIKDIDWIFNWGIPKTAIYYLHRCGRTGRAGRAGSVYNLVTSFDTRLIALINEAIKKQSVLNLGLIAASIKDVKRPAKTVKKKASGKKIKTKRVKVTKRSRL